VIADQLGHRLVRGARHAGGLRPVGEGHAGSRDRHHGRLDAVPVHQAEILLDAPARIGHAGDRLIDARPVHGLQVRVGDDVVVHIDAVRRHGVARPSSGAARAGHGVPTE
jgi:hypothetical protein